MRRRLPGSAALVLIEANAKLQGKSGEGHETLSCVAVACLRRITDRGYAFGQAEGTYEYSAGAHFNGKSWRTFGDYLRNEVARREKFPARSC